jgi:hypothetical protein
MGLKPENIELQNKIMAGATKAYKKLVIESAEKNQKLVIADKDGNVQLVDAKDLLKSVENQ